MSCYIIAYIDETITILKKYTCMELFVAKINMELGLGWHEINMLKINSNTFQV